jgi:hypothetical protein
MGNSRKWEVGPLQPSKRAAGGCLFGKASARSVVSKTIALLSHEAGRSRRSFPCRPTLLYDDADRDDARGACGASPGHQPATHRWSWREPPQPPSQALHLPRRHSSSSRLRDALHGGHSGGGAGLRPRHALADDGPGLRRGAHTRRRRARAARSLVRDPAGRRCAQCRGRGGGRRPGHVHERLEERDSQAGVDERRGHQAARARRAPRALQLEPHRRRAAQPHRKAVPRAVAQSPESDGQEGGERRPLSATPRRAAALEPRPLLSPPRAPARAHHAACRVPAQSPPHREEEGAPE